LKGIVVSNRLTPEREKAELELLNTVTEEAINEACKITFQERQFGPVAEMNTIEKVKALEFIKYAETRRAHYMWLQEQLAAKVEEKVYMPRGIIEDKARDGTKVITFKTNGNKKKKEK
jgi:hypothetical protein